jgi:alpha-N-acetylglucosaminidase
VKLDYYAMEEPWTLQQNPYSAAPEGNPVGVAKEAMKLMSNVQCSMLNEK